MLSSKKAIWILGVVAVIAVGFCGYELFYANDAAVSTSNTKKKSTSNSKKYWNDNKDNKLKSFMNDFDDTYEQVTKNNKLKFNQMSLPSDLKNIKMKIGEKTVTGEWSTTGVGNQDYEIVAAYTNAENDTDNAKLYLFTIHNDAPTILQTTSTASKPTVTVVHDADLIDNFEKVIDGKIPSLESASSSTNTSQTKDEVKEAKSRLDLTQLATNDFSSLVGTWKNESDGSTIVVTDKTMDRPNGKNISYSVGAVIDGKDDPDGYPEIIGTSNINDGYLIAGIGTFNPNVMGGATPLSIIPAGVDGSSAIYMGNDDSDISRDRLISGGGQSGFASDAYYRE